MRKNTGDKAFYRNYVRKWKFLVQEYEWVPALSVRLSDKAW